MKRLKRLALDALECTVLGIALGLILGLVIVMTG
jgi:hypothetical protein